MPDAITPAPQSLDRLFRPGSIAVIGASSDPTKIGGRPIAYLLNARYAGRIHPVNPTQTTIQGLPCLRRLEDAPGPVDMVILALPAHLAEQAVASCIAMNVGAIVMFTSGLGEVDEAGAVLQRTLAERCRAAGIRLLGPNCLGVCNIADRVLATFSASIPDADITPGRIAVVSQSGAFGTYVLTMLLGRGAGFSHFVATGNEADVDVADCVAWLAADPATSIIMLAMEGCRDGARLRRALAAAAAARKPVIAMKVGTSALGAAAAASHTGALAGTDSAYAAALAEGGAYRAASIEEMVDLGVACAAGCFPRGRRLGIATISGGVGVLMADVATDLGLELPALPDRAQAAIRALLPFANPRNPVDTTAQVINDPSLFARMMDVMADEGGFDGIIVFFALMGRNAVRMMAAREVLLAIRARDPNRAIVLCLVCSPEIRRTLEADGFFVMEEPSRAVRATAGLMLFERAWAAHTMPEAVAARRLDLPPGAIDEAQAKAVLAAVGIAFVPERIVRTAMEAADAAAALGFPVALKVLSPDLPHKSEMGGVRLGLASGAEVEAAWSAMMSAIRSAAPQARITGGLVAPMVSGVETVIGVHRDPAFGPIAMFGIGGVFVEVLRDVSFRLAPLTRQAALDQIGAIKGGSTAAWRARNRAGGPGSDRRHAGPACPLCPGARERGGKRGDQSVHRDAAGRCGGGCRDPAAQLTHNSQGAPDCWAISPHLGQQVRADRNTFPQAAPGLGALRITCHLHRP